VNYNVTSAAPNKIKRPQPYITKGKTSIFISKKYIAYLPHFPAATIFLYEAKRGRFSKNQTRRRADQKRRADT